MDASKLSIAERLRLAREWSALSARALSGLAKLDPSHVRLIEAGKRSDPSAKTLAALARVLGVTTDWLIDGSDPQPTAASVRAAVALALPAAA